MAVRTKGKNGTRITDHGTYHSPKYPLCMMSVGYSLFSCAFNASSTSNFAGFLPGGNPLNVSHSRQQNLCRHNCSHSSNPQRTVIVGSSLRPLLHIRPEFECSLNRKTTGSDRTSKDFAGCSLKRGPSNSQICNLPLANEIMIFGTQSSSSFASETAPE